MRVEYWVELPCEPKRKLGVDGLRERLRDLNRLSGGAGVTQEDATRALEAGFALRPIAFHCARCPANHARREFGCLSAVPLPLSAAAEEWLMRLLPPTLKPREDQPEARAQASALRELLRRLREARLSPARPSNDGALLAGPEPLTRSYGFFLKPERVSSRRLLDLFLFDGELSPRMAETALRALGVWRDGQTSPDGVREAVFTQPVESADDPSVAALKRLFMAVMVACSLEVGVRSQVVE